MTGVHVNVQKVNKKFAKLEVLKDIDLELHPGEFLAIVGRSGCGKSTFLRLISGLEQATSGSIAFNDQQIQGIHPNMRIMFQDARLLPWKTVVQNVIIGTKKETASKAQQALHLVGLEDKRDQWPSTLSGGQRQRVALARALVGEPRLLLLDEPLGALDALTRIEMQLLIENLWFKQQFTSILVTHDVSEAVTLADRVIVIEEGEISLDIKIQLARPREKNSDFAYYERVILDQLMKQNTEPVIQKVDYSI